MKKNEIWCLFPNFTIISSIKLYFFHKKVLQQISGMPNEIKMGILMKGKLRFYVKGSWQSGREDSTYCWGNWFNWE